MTGENICKRDNFLHKTVNVSDWMKEEINTYATINGYSVVSLNVECEVMTRMDKISVMNTIDMKLMDKEGNVITLENYSSTNEEYDNQSTKWMVDYIKEREVKALLKFGGVVLGTEHKEYENPECTGEFEVYEKKKHEDLCLTAFSVTNIDEFKDFFTNSTFLKMWGGPTSKLEDHEFTCENLILRDIVFDADCIKMKYKWNDWSEFSDVILKLKQVGDCVKIDLIQKNIPIGLVDNVINHWKTKIFYPIAMLFRCPVRYDSC